MDVVVPDLFANLANLRDQLKSAERLPGFEIWGYSIRADREALVQAISSCRRSRFDLGRTLARYRNHFKATHHWMKTVKVITAALEVGERTVHRILSQSEHASNWSPEILVAMRDQNIDPAAEKNADLVNDLLLLRQPPSRREAEIAVEEAQKKRVDEKKQRKLAARKPGSTDRKQFVAKIVKLIRDRVRLATPKERDAELRAIIEQLTRTFDADKMGLDRISYPSAKPSMNSPMPLN